MRVTSWFGGCCLGLTCAGVFLLFASSVAFARPGGLDPSFGVGGRLVRDLPSPMAIAVQRDGRILSLVGSTLLRFTQRGRLDRSLGGSGRVVVRRRGLVLDFHAVSVQRDGRIVLGGSVRSGTTTGMALTRLLTDGRLDPSFGDKGLVADFSPADSEIASLLFEPDGRMVVVGSVSGGLNEDGNSKSDFLLARFTANGLRDMSFGSGGATRTDVRLGDVPRGLVRQRDGRLVLGGISVSCGSGAGEECDRGACETTDVHCAAELIRYSNDGLLDRSFGVSGSGAVSITPFDFAAPPIQEPSGRIVVLGGRQIERVTAPATSYISNEALVAEVGPDGQFTRRRNLRRLRGAFSDALIVGTVRQADGKLVVAGFDLVGRVTRNGRVDAGFGRNGVVRLKSPPGGETVLTSLARAPDGKIIAAGYQSNAAGIRLLMIRLRAR